MKAKHNLRIPVIVGWLATSAVVVIGVVLGNDILADIGSISCGIVTIFVSLVLAFGGHTELLAGASEPVELGKYGKIFVVVLAIILFLSGLSVVITPFITH